MFSKLHFYRAYATVFVLLSSLQMQSQIGIGTTDPNPHAAIDIDGSSGGLLLPKVALQSASSHQPIGDHVIGMTVYNTATAGSGANAVTPGFYVNDGDKWIRLADDSEPQSEGWSVTGNSGLAGSNFLGTTDEQALRFRTNNEPHFEITHQTTLAPKGRLHAFGNGSAAYPTYSFKTRNGTGMFSPEVDQLGFSTDGKQRVRILNNEQGSVVINDDEPFGTFRLTVTEPSTGSGWSYPAIVGYSRYEEGVQGRSGSGAGVVGRSTEGAGVFGHSEATNTGAFASAGGQFENFKPNGIGAIIVGGQNKDNLLWRTTGTGAAVMGRKIGTSSFSTDNTGIGVIGVGNNITPANAKRPSNGAGVVGNAKDTGYGVYGHNTDGSGYGMYSDGNMMIVGNLEVTGTINGEAFPPIGPRGFPSGMVSVDDTEMNVDGLIRGSMLTAVGTKNFEIDHPLDPANKYLKHASVESNEILNLYRGTAVFDADGLAQVQLPEYYSEINQDETYQLTPIGAAMPNLYIAEKVSNNRFVIGGGAPGKEVSWTVTAERNDAYVRSNPAIREMEVDKKENRGRYMSPEAYGQSSDRSVIQKKTMSLEKYNNKKKLAQRKQKQVIEEEVIAQKQKTYNLEPSERNTENLKPKENLNYKKKIDVSELQTIEVEKLENVKAAVSESASSSSSATLQEQSHSEVAPSEGQNNLQQQETPRLDHKN